MGFFSKLWSGVKNVFKGILKVFSPILKPLAKILNSSWGKALLLAVSVFTFGAALMAGGSAFAGTLAGGQGFIQAFVEGGKAFVGSLLGTGAKDAATTAEGATNAAGLTEGAIAGGIDPMALNAAEGAGEVAAAGSSAFGPAASGDAVNRMVTAGTDAGAAGAGAMLPAAGEVSGTGLLSKAAGNVAKTSQLETGGNWLTKAAKNAWDFAKTDMGQNLIGAGLEGYGAGKRDEALFEHQSRYDAMWRDPSQTQPIRDLAAGFGPEIPAAWNRDASTLANERNRNYRPSVPYTRAPTGG